MGGQPLRRESEEAPPPPEQALAPTAEPAPERAPARSTASATPTGSLSVELSKVGWGGSFLLPDLEIEGLVHGVLIDRSEVIVVDSRGAEIRHDRLGDVDRFLARVAERSDHQSIRWKYEVDGKKLLGVKFPVTVRVVVYDATGASSEQVVEVDR